MNVYRVYWLYFINERAFGVHLITGKLIAAWRGAVVDTWNCVKGKFGGAFVYNII